MSYACTRSDKDRVQGLATDEAVTDDTAATDGDKTVTKILGTQAVW